MNSGASCSNSSTPQGRPAIGNEPNQPSGFHFPMREFGIKTVVKRAFNPKWFTKWPWLHYSSSDDRVYCFTCISAIGAGKLSGNVKESAFATTGVRLHKLERCNCCIWSSRIIQCPQTSC